MLSYDYPLNVVWVGEDVCCHSLYRIHSSIRSIESVAYKNNIHPHMTWCGTLYSKEYQYACFLGRDRPVSV
jgi:hypothetical protein